MPSIVLFLLFCLAGFSLNVSATDISVSLDRSPVSVDESFQILFTANESPDAAPDFSPLEQDFTIQNQSENSRFEFVNGKSNRIVQWIVTVMANDTGNLIIPVIKFGNDASPPLKITVSPSSTNKNSVHDELFLEVSVNTEKPLIQSQVLYTVKLYRRIDLAKANLNEPELSDAVIEKLAVDANYTTQVSGVNYAVIERKYAIFPQKSGSMTIKPLMLTADVIARGKQSHSFFNSQITQRHIIKSNAITLEVQPIPTTLANTHWLVAENVTLTQKWSGDITQMKVGEPLTRTVTLVAQGSMVGQLPELTNTSMTTAIKAYNDQAVLNEDKTPTGIVATREEKTAFIPAKAGTYNLPAIQVAWFNMLSHKMEFVTLPAMTLTVNAEAGMATQPEEPAVVVEQKNNSVTSLTESISHPLETKKDFFWQGVAIFSILGWLITLLFVFLKRNRVSKNVTETVENFTKISLKTTVKKLKQACEKNDPHAAKIALLEWGKLQFNEMNLADIASHCEARFRDEILLLNAVLYAKNPSLWQGKKLFQTFSENNARSQLNLSVNKNTLQPLYRL